jgi:hypothetical protein
MPEPFCKNRAHALICPLNGRARLVATIAAEIERLWNDPVWSKVIAAGVITLIGLILARRGAVFDSWTAGFWRVVSWLGKKHRQAPNVKVVDIDIPPQDNSRGFPLKCYVTLQNNSTECPDVCLSEYRARKVTLKRFTFDVLQVKLRDWCPTGEGVNRVAVLPEQLFRAWVGLDEMKFSGDQVNILRGQMGTLVFLVDGKTVPIDL